VKTRAFLFALVLAALAFGIGMAVFFRDWVRQEIVLPVTYVFWTLGLLLRSIDQAVYWGLLVAVGCLIAFYALWPSGLFARSQIEPVRPGGTRSRYHQWYTYFDNLEESRFAGDSLAREMVRFTVLILAYQQNVSAEEIYHLIDNGEIALPEDFLAFLHRREFVNKPKPEPVWLDFIYQYLPRPHKSHPPDHLSPIEEEAQSILGHIEMLLSPQENPLEVVIEQPTPQHADS
jgi:hypothetical protein